MLTQCYYIVFTSLPDTVKLGKPVNNVHFIDWHVI